MRRVQRMIGMTAVLVLAVGAVTAQAQPQLAGTWMLDNAQSQFPAHGDKGPGGADAQGTQPKVKLVVEQQGNVVKVTRTTVMGSRERSMTETYVTDGTDQAQRSEERRVGKECRCGRSAEHERKKEERGDVEET